MRRRDLIHHQRFAAMCNVALNECARLDHDMRPVANYPMALTGTRQRWRCENCRRILTVDISGACNRPSRYGSALEYDCKGEKQC